MAGSLVTHLLSKPAYFLELPDQVRHAVQHLVSCLVLMKAGETADSPTLGILEELHPLVASFKKFKGGNSQALEALEDGAKQVDASGGSSNGKGGENKSSKVSFRLVTACLRVLFGATDAAELASLYRVFLPLFLS